MGAGPCGSGPSPRKAGKAGRQDPRDLPVSDKPATIRPQGTDGKPCGGSVPGRYFTAGSLKCTFIPPKDRVNVHE